MPLDYGTPELTRHRAAVVGDDNVRRQEAGDELGILMLRGVITQGQRQAGIEYARLRRVVCGAPHCAIAGYGESQDPSPLGGPSEGDQRRWERCLRALKPLGALAKSELDSVAVFDRRPGWLYRHINGQERPGDDRRRKLLRDALTALERVT